MISVDEKGGLRTVVYIFRCEFKIWSCGIVGFLIEAFWGNFHPFQDNGIV